jgi:hypothetical protein
VRIIGSHPLQAAEQLGRLGRPEPGRQMKIIEWYDVPVPLGRRPVEVVVGAQRLGHAGDLQRGQHRAGRAREAQLAVQLFARRRAPQPVLEAALEQLTAGRGADGRMVRSPAAGYDSLRRR